jgi:uncharacterized membrane protein/protein-disulfide isomerase
MESDMNGFSSALAIGFSGAAMTLSAWLLLKSSGTNSLPGCEAGSGCDAVTRSRWARLGPLPVAGIGMLVYTLLFSSLLASRLNPSSTLNSQILVHALSITALLAVGGAVWFMAVQLILLRRFCFYCTLTHILASVAAVCALTIVLEAGMALAADWILGFGTLVAFVAGQIVLTPRTYAIAAASGKGVSAEPIEEKAAGTPPPMPLPEIHPLGNSTQLPQVERSIRLYGGRVTLSLAKWPLLGSPEAPEVLAVLMDFTCKECHHLHRLLYQAIAHYGGRLAVVVAPVPIHRDCNPAVTCHKSEQVYSCALARLAWAVWLSDPQKYLDWDHFMAESDEPQPFGLALAKAKELCDISRFKIREDDEMLNTHIAKGVKVASVIGKIKVPALVLDGGVLHGHVKDVAALRKLIEPRFKALKASANSVRI